MFLEFDDMTKEKDGSAVPARDLLWMRKCMFSQMSCFMFG